MADSSIQLHAELDQRNSQKNINADIKKLQGQVNSLKLQTNLDPKSGSNLGRQLKKNIETEIKGIKTDNAESLLSTLSTAFTKKISKAASLLYEKLKSAVFELKAVNTLLTEIGKTNDKLSKSDLSNIGSHSFEIASRYGKKAADYLSAVQAASRTGYENVEDIAELSIAAQSAGSMTAELANQLIAAADEAYGMNGSVTKLKKVLDGMNSITNHNAVNMSQLSEGLSIAGATAASLGVDINETAAALSTMIAITQQSASETANAFRSVLLNIRQVADEEAGIDAEGLAKYEDACNALNVRLKEMKNGVISLRNPMNVLRELAKAYNQLDETDVRRTNLLDAAGSKADSAQLDALLRNWGTYETMLQQYADGTGSMAAEAEKTVNSWKGSLNRLSNTWTDTIGNLVDSDAVVTVINSLNGLLSAVNAVTERFPWGSIGALSGLLMNKNGIGERTVFRGKLYCAHPSKVI